MERLPCVYVIENTVTGEKYVGSTECFHQRAINHRCAMRMVHSGVKDLSQKRLVEAYTTYPPDAFTIRPLIVGDSEELPRLEYLAIQTLQPAYNHKVTGRLPLEREHHRYPKAPKPPKPKWVKPAATYTVQGVTGTIKQLSAHFGLKEYVVRSRRQAGWSMEEALTRPPGVSHSSTLYTVRGVTGTVHTLAAHFGVDSGTARSRIRDGWTVEAAVTTPADPTRGRFTRK